MILYDKTTKQAKCDGCSEVTDFVEPEILVDFANLHSKCCDHEIVDGTCMKCGNMLV